MPKPLKITKAVLYITAAVLIFIFYKSIMPYVAFLVGGVILAYALEELGFQIARRHFAELAGSLIQIVLAVLLFLSHSEIEKVCVIWGVWSIIREGRELSHALAHIKKNIRASLNILESIVVTVLSVMLVLTPGEHHAQIHLIILGVELILEILFPFLDEVVERIKQKKEEPAPQKPQ